MDKLQCPFTWSVIPLDEMQAKLLRDRLPLAVRPWDVIVKKSLLAFSEFCRGNVDQSRVLIVDSLMHLFYIPDVGLGCDLTNLYRQAVKHILDGTWAFIRRSQCVDSQSQEHLDTFVNNILPFNSMDPKEQAAVHAFRAHFTTFPENHIWAIRAVSLSPDEGQWHYYVASMLFDADQAAALHKNRDEELRGALYREILHHNSECKKLRPDAPESMLLFAKLCSGGDDKSQKFSRLLIQNVVKKFPGNAFVREESAEILHLTSQGTLFSLLKSSFFMESLYVKALELCGECLSLRYKVGLAMIHVSKLNFENCEGDYEVGMENIRKAATLIPEAKATLKKLECKDAPLPEAAYYVPKLNLPARIASVLTHYINLNLFESDGDLDINSDSPGKKKKKRKQKAS